MAQISPIIEIHFYSSGLKAKHIGVQPRPEWLPNFEVVGLRDIQLDNDDYVIELSRHERDNKLITWIGVWSKGVDLTAGDRGANYIGLGVWLIDVVPAESYMIVSSLVKICDLLVNEGIPTDKVLNTCNTLLNDPRYMQKWIKDINELPLVDKGLVFQEDEYLQTIYIKPKDSDLQKAIIATSESILINCVNAVADFKDKSQILYLILTPGSKADGNKTIKELNNNPNVWFDYVSNLNKSNKDKNAGLLHDISKLENENQNKANQIKIIEEDIIQLNIINRKLNDEVTKKTESEQLVDLKTSIVNLIERIKQQSTILESKNIQGLRQPFTPQSNSNDEVLRKLYSLIANQRDTLNLIVRNNGTVKSNPEKKTHIDQYGYIAYTVVVALILAICLVFLHPRNEVEVKHITQEQPQSRNINIDDVKELNSKLDNISSTVGSIENKIESSILVKETKINSPISLEQAPSNSGKIGNSKVSKNNKKSK